MRVLLLNRVENIVAKREIACRLLQMRQNASICGKGLRLYTFRISFQVQRKAEICDQTEIEAWTDGLW